MKIKGVDGVDFINIGPAHTTELGRLLHLSTEAWFSTAEGRCLTLIGYHYHNVIRKLMLDHAIVSDTVPGLEHALHKLLTSSAADAKTNYQDCVHMLSQRVGKKLRSVEYPSEWQIPSIYARLSMHPSPVDAFYVNSLPIVWIDGSGGDACDTRIGVGRYIETILKLRNDHVKHIG